MRLLISKDAQGRAPIVCDDLDAETNEICGGATFQVLRMPNGRTFLKCQDCFELYEIFDALEAEET